MEKLTLKNVNRELIGIIRDEFIDQLAQGHNRYYHEHQVQHKLGIEWYKRFGIEPTLEWCVEDPETHKRRYIDIMLDLGGKKVGIELKYKTKEVKGANYMGQGAQSNGKFFFFQDIERLEKLKKKSEIENGFAVLITNDHLYWNPAQNGKAVKKFDLCAGTKPLHGKYEVDWGEYKGQSVTLSGTYTVEWVEVPAAGAQKDGTTFRYLIIKV